MYMALSYVHHSVSLYFLHIEVSFTLALEIMMYLPFIPLIHSKNKKKFLIFKYCYVLRKVIHFLW